MFKVFGLIAYMGKFGGNIPIQLWKLWGRGENKIVNFMIYVVIFPE